MKRRILISVSNDAVTDQRVRKQCEILTELGFDIQVYCRNLGREVPKSDLFQIRRFNLLFNTGMLFYASLNIRLFFTLLFAKADLFYANDLDTLPANALASAFRRKPLIYDSHEYFTEVPEIQDKPLVKLVWRFFERIYIHRAKMVITVSESIAALLEETYSLSEKVTVVRNVPRRGFKCKPLDRNEAGIDPNTFLIILQGAGINIDRGSEELVEAMQFVRNSVLMIIGSGDALPVLKEMTERLELKQKVVFVSKLPYPELMRYTAMADLGVSLDKDTNINYRFSLPNKLFDYARAEIPVLTSNLVEVQRIVKSYEIGECVEVISPKVIAKTINFLRENPELMQKFKRNTTRLKNEINWETEFKPVVEKIKDLVR